MITVFVVALIVCALAMLLLVLGLRRRPRRHCGDRCTCADDRQQCQDGAEDGDRPESESP